MPLAQFGMFPRGGGQLHEETTATDSMQPLIADQLLRQEFGSAVGIVDVHVLWTDQAKRNLRVKYEQAKDGWLPRLDFVLWPEPRLCDHMGQVAGLLRAALAEKKQAIVRASPNDFDSASFVAAFDQCLLDLEHAPGVWQLIGKGRLSPGISGLKCGDDIGAFSGFFKPDEAFPQIVFDTLQRMIPVVTGPSSLHDRMLALNQLNQAISPWTLSSERLIRVSARFPASTAAWQQSLLPDVSADRRAELLAGCQNECLTDSGVRGSTARGLELLRKAGQGGTPIPGDELP